MKKVNNISALHEVVPADDYTINGVPLTQWALLTDDEKLRLRAIAQRKARLIEQQPAKKPRRQPPTGPDQS